MCTSTNPTTSANNKTDIFTVAHKHRPTVNPLLLSTGGNLNLRTLATRMSDEPEPVVKHLKLQTGLPSAGVDCVGKNSSWETSAGIPSAGMDCSIIENSNLETGLPSGRVDSMVKNSTLETGLSSAGVDCSKSNKSLFVGLLVTVLTVVAVSCYFMLEERRPESSCGCRVVLLH